MLYLQKTKHMKKLLTIIALISLFSCKKEDSTPLLDIPKEYKEVVYKLSATDGNTVTVWVQNESDSIIHTFKKDTLTIKRAVEKGLSYSIRSKIHCTAAEYNYNISVFNVAKIDSLHGVLYTTKLNRTTRNANYFKYVDYTLKGIVN